MTDLKLRQNNKSAQKDGEGSANFAKRFISSGAGGITGSSGNCRPHGYTINNSLGKKTLNMSQHYNDSSLYEMNATLGRNGAGG
mmetsp:Transcript_10906/g.11045  ORF Transcript_10906/g.11045 Transcript_10906/m.11045 type:complete len:84 (+) Transcript_10906:1441-1692(+)